MRFSIKKLAGFFLKDKREHLPKTKGLETVSEKIKTPPRWSIIKRYTVGSVKYYLYRGNEGLVHLGVEEPTWSNEAIDVASGLRKAKSPEEEYIADKIRSGYASLYPLIIDPNVEEISYSGNTNNVNVIHALVPSRWIVADILISKEDADSIAIELARKAGKTISIASPYAEGITSEGHRISVSFLNEISHFGSSFILRKYPKRPFTMSDAIASKMVSALIASYLWIIAEAQGFIIISGSMGSGKTAFLQSIASLLPPYSKVITIEDTPELRLLTPNWDSLVTRPKLPGEEIVEVGMEELLKLALRRRADYVIVGEVRGREARLLAQAATSGYGALTTMHASSPSSALMRLSFEPIRLPRLFIRSITAIVQMRVVPSFGGKATRKVFEVDEVYNGRLLKMYGINESLPSPEEIIRKSKNMENGLERLGFSRGEKAEEFLSRIEFLEKNSGKNPKDFYSSLSKFYVEKYGDVI